MVESDTLPAVKKWCLLAGKRSKIFVNSGFGLVPRPEFYYNRKVYHSN